MTRQKSSLAKQVRTHRPLNENRWSLVTCYMKHSTS